MKNIELFRFFEQRIPNNKVAKAALLNKIRESKGNVEEISDYFNLPHAIINREISEMLSGPKPQKMNKNKTKLLSEALIAQEVLNEKYQKLTPAEKKVVDLVESNDFIRIKRQVKITERMCNHLSGYHKQMVKECTTAIKNNAFTLKEAAYKVCELQETVKDLLKENSEQYKITGFKYLKNVNVSCIDDSDAPETIFIEFNVEVYPEGTQYMEIKHSLEGIDRSFRKIGTNIVNTALFWKDKAGDLFTGEFIWDASVRTNQVSKAGSKVLGKGELALYTVAGNTLPFKQFKQPVLDILKEIDANIVSWIPEIDKQKQQISINYAPTKEKGPAKPSSSIDFEDDDSIENYLKKNL